MQEAQLPPSRWDDGKDSCGKARKLGLPHKGQGMLAMGKRNLLQPLPQLLCLGENVGTAIARAVPELPAQSSAELQVGSEGSEATARCWPGLGAPGRPSLPTACHAVLPAGRARGVAHFFGGEIKPSNLCQFSNSRHDYSISVLQHPAISEKHYASQLMIMSLSLR